MKKTLLLLFITVSTFAQTEPKVINQSDSTVSITSNGKSQVKNHEISLNAFDLVMGGALNIGYEQLFEDSQSMTLKVMAFDNPNYKDYDKRNLFSIQAQYNIYFNEKKRAAGLFFSPFMRYTFGTYGDDYYSSYYQSSNKLSALIAGFSLGYKVLLKDKWSLGISNDFGRILSRNNESYYNASSFEGRFGIAFGVRF